MPCVLVALSSFSFFSSSSSYSYSFPFPLFFSLSFVLRSFPISPFAPILASLATPYPLAYLYQPGHPLPPQACYCQHFLVFSIVYFVLPPARLVAFSHFHPRTLFFTFVPSSSLQRPVSTFLVSRLTPHALLYVYNGLETSPPPMPTFGFTCTSSDISLSPPCCFSRLPAVYPCLASRVHPLPGCPSALRSYHSLS